MLHATDQIEHDSQAYGPDLVSLVEDLAGRYEPYPAGAVNTYVDRVFEIAWANELEDALWRMLPRDECLRYASPEEPISLAVARRIAFRLEVPLAELLSASKPVIQSFGFAYGAPLPRTMAPGVRPKAVGRKALRQRMMSTLEVHTAPESLRAVARRLGVSVGAISYHCSDLADAVVRRRQAYLKEASVLIRVEAKVVVKRAIATWAPSDGPMTRKALLRRLFPSAGIPKTLIRAEILAQCGST